MNPVRNKLTGSGWSFKNIKVFIRIISNGMKISLQIHRPKILFAGSLLLLLLVLLIPAGITHAEGLLGWVFGAADVAAGWTIGALLTPVVAIVTSLMAILTTFAGTLFDFAISYTIIEYSKELGGPIQEGINVVWVMFRDIANIVLIGVFVYIAFNVMLNVSNFDAPKFAARVLVIAVLINFSLFFTKVIIDVSNITAIQFYETLIADSNNKEIAEAFMGKVGISSTWANQSFLTDTISATSQGITKLLAYAIFTSLFLAAVASIFLYAVILLFSRALTFIFLMVTSPLAFAAFMVPQMEKHWKTWWSLLLKNALFAPLLMMMLWATLTITENLNGDGKSLVDAINGNLGALGGLINIVIILGLFYASVRISSDLSLMGTDIADKISKKSFGFMAKWGGAGIAGQMALGTASWGLRTVVGRGAKKVRKWNRGLPKMLSSQRLDKALKKVQKSGMRIGDIKPLKEATKSATGVALTATPELKDISGFLQKRIEQEREGRAKKEQKTASKVLDKTVGQMTTGVGGEKEKYGKMQKDQLQMYQNTLNKDLSASKTTQKDALRTIQDIEKALSAPDADPALTPGLEAQKTAAKETVAKETAKIEQVRAQIIRAEGEKEAAGRGDNINTALQEIHEAVQAFGDDSIAKREIDAIHSMGSELRKQLMSKQYFDKEAYQVPEKVPGYLGKVERFFDPNAEEVHKQARKDAKFPEHYDRMGGRTKDEAVSNAEIVDRAIKDLTKRR